MHNHMGTGSPVDTDGAPTITLGGASWPVPVLSARQNKIIDPLILSLLPLFEQWHTDRAAALGTLGASHYETLQEIAYQAIRRAHPELSRDAFLDLPVTLPELVAAFATVARQTGVFERAAPGEAEAGIAPPKKLQAEPLTGMASSPMSAT